VVGSVVLAVVLSVHKEPPAAVPATGATSGGEATTMVTTAAAAAAGGMEEKTSDSGSDSSTASVPGLTFHPEDDTKPTSPAVASLTLPTAGIRTKQSFSQQQPQDDDDGTCLATDTPSLVAAVASSACVSIRLTNPERDAYILPEELFITRYVSIYGHPVLLPTIDAGACCIYPSIVSPTYLHPRPHLPVHRQVGARPFVRSVS